MHRCDRIIITGECDKSKGIPLFLLDVAFQNLTVFLEMRNDIHKARFKWEITHIYLRSILAKVSFLASSIIVISFVQWLSLCIMSWWLDIAWTVRYMLRRMVGSSFIGHFISANWINVLRWVHWLWATRFLVVILIILRYIVPWAVWITMAIHWWHVSILFLVVLRLSWIVLHVSWVKSWLFNFIEIDWACLLMRYLNLIHKCRFMRLGTIWRVFKTILIQEIKFEIFFLIFLLLRHWRSLYWLRLGLMQGIILKVIIK